MPTWMPRGENRGVRAVWVVTACCPAPFLGAEKGMTRSLGSRRSWRDIGAPEPPEGGCPGVVLQCGL